jgi:alkanesulfonate monooxygenase SsuD/methylene tetrahydromethanopterin reductase-like flavin-dependent oxidoreductase (luciferase family)
MHYRANHVDEHGRFHQMPHVLSAETDQEAVAQAKQLINGYDVELWQGERLVTKLKAVQLKYAFQK